MTNTKRIEYIDALRGFTMTLVVMMHVFVITADDMSLPFSSAVFFAQFRLPLFFFISGFVLYKKDFDWNNVNIIKFIKKKTPVQIISPCIFILVLSIISHIRFLHILTSENRYGYWFTFALFEYYILYIIFIRIAKAINLKGYKEDLFLLLSALAVSFTFSDSHVHDYVVNNKLLLTIGLQVWTFYIYMVIGTRIRKHFNKFEELLDSRYFTFACVVIFLAVTILHFRYDITNPTLEFAGGFSGVMLVFALFRKNQDIFQKQRLTGRIAQYVGRHTLDIYLLHFILLRGCEGLFVPVFEQTTSVAVEFILSLLFAACIIAYCLGISLILRLSPLLAHWLFGAKIMKEQ